MEENLVTLHCNKNRAMSSWLAEPSCGKCVARHSPEALMSSWLCPRSPRAGVNVLNSPHLGGKREGHHSQNISISCSTWSRRRPAPPSTAISRSETIGRSPKMVLSRCRRDRSWSGALVECTHSFTHGLIVAATIEVIKQGEQASWLPRHSPES